MLAPDYVQGQPWRRAALYRARTRSSQLQGDEYGLAAPRYAFGNGSAVVVGFVHPQNLLPGWAGGETAAGYARILDVFATRYRAREGLAPPTISVERWVDHQLEHMSPGQRSFERIGQFRSLEKRAVANGGAITPFQSKRARVRFTNESDAIQYGTVGGFPPSEEFGVQAFEPRRGRGPASGWHSGALPGCRRLPSSSSSSSAPHTSFPAICSSGFSHVLHCVFGFISQNHFSGRAVSSYSGRRAAGASSRTGRIAPSCTSRALRRPSRPRPPPHPPPRPPPHPPLPPPQ